MGETERSLFNDDSDSDDGETIEDVSNLSAKQGQKEIDEDFADDEFAEDDFGPDDFDHDNASGIGGQSSLEAELLDGWELLDQPKKQKKTSKDGIIEKLTWTGSKPPGGY